MPRREDIEQFREILYTLGSEPQITARRAEVREDAPGQAPTATPSPFAEDTGESTEPAALDLDDLLGDASESPAPPPAPEAPADQELDEAAFGFDAEPAPAAAEGLDLGGLFGDTPGEPGAPREMGVSEPEQPETLPDLGFDLDQPDVDPGMRPTEEAPAAEPPGEPWESAGGPVAEPAPEADAEAWEPPAEAGTEAGEPPSEPGAEPGVVDFGDLDALAGETAPADEPSEETAGEPPFDFGAEPSAEAPAIETPPEGPEEPEGVSPSAEAEGDLPAPEQSVFGAEAMPEEPAAAEAGLPEEPQAERPLETFGEELEAQGAGPVEPGEDLRTAAPEGVGAEGGEFDLGGFDTETLASLPEAAAGTESVDELAEGFTLEGLSDQVGEAPLTEAEGGEEAEVPPATPREPSVLTLEDREFRAIERNLEELPRNLKIAVETLLGEQGYTGQGLRHLLDQLIGGDAPEAIAASVSKITGSTIRIPARFQRQTGAEFEAERGTLAYVLRTSVLPVLRTLVLVVGVLGVLTYGAYTLVYQPLYARALYGEGYRALERSDYGEAERSFGRAVLQRRIRSWYFRYAEGYVEQRRYQDASQKYTEIVAAFGYDKQAYLDHARLQSERMGNYAVAESLLSNITDVDFFDRDAGLANGDNYLEWARRAPEPEGENTEEALLEKARVSYARVLERYGYRNDALFRMMLYFVRADRIDEVRELRTYLETDDRFRPDPDVYAEVGGYLLDKGDVEEARDVLLAAHEVSVVIPEIDYNLARLYRQIDERGEEGRALRNTLIDLESAERTPERVFMEIDTRRRNGDWLYREDRVLEAAEEYTRSIELTEEALRDRIVGPRSELGLPYVGLGNVRYDESNYEQALGLYLASRQRGLEDTDVDYRIGYIRYAQGDYARSVEELVPLQELEPQNWNALFATATALFQRGDYFAAEGYYRRLIDRLLARRDEIRDLRPESNPEHFTLANLLLKAHNNLGVAYYEQGLMRGGRGRELARALVEITEASRYLDAIARDPETLERSEAKNLAYLNADAIQHPTSGFVPLIYDRIPRDLESVRF